MQGGHDVGVDLRDHLRNRRQAVAQRGQDLTLAHQAMVDVLLDPRRPVFDDRPVRRVDPANVQPLESLQRAHVVEQVAVAGRDDRRGSGQHHVAREQRLLLHEVVAEMVRGVARRVDDDERGAVGLDFLAVAQIVDRLG